MMVTSQPFFFEVKHYLKQSVSAAPLRVFRGAFGLMMTLSILRFLAMGWVNDFYIQPTFFFSYYGFDWVKPIAGAGMYVVFALLLFAAVLVMLGVYFRMSMIAFFLLFTYVELLDKTYYLNHYYFISLVSFLMCWLPMTAKSNVPRWTIVVLQLQLAIVYFFAGVAKINPDWLMEAMPLKIWLAAKTHLPLIGVWLDENWVAFVFSWVGMFFDVLIAFFLFNKKTVWWAYGVVVVFHLLTAIIFPGIGVFPFVMIVGATIFLPNTFHRQIIEKWEVVIKSKKHLTFEYKFKNDRTVYAVMAIYFLLQILLPLRSHVYGDNLFYHEQGYRFSWRVMLMEKAGIVFFTVKDKTGRMVEVKNSEYLTTQQEKQMSTQPDMILQFAHYLAKVYQTDEVYAESYVTVNGRGSRPFVSNEVNLVKQQDGFKKINWVLAKVD